MKNHGNGTRKEEIMKRKVLNTFVIAFILLFIFSCTNVIKQSEQNISLKISLGGVANDYFSEQTGAKFFGKVEKLNLKEIKKVQSFDKEINITHFKVYIFCDSQLLISKDIYDSNIYLKFPENASPGVYLIKVEGYDKDKLIFFGEKEEKISYGVNDITIYTVFANGDLKVNVTNNVEEYTITEIQIKGTLPASSSNNFIKADTLNFDVELYPGVWNITIEATLIDNETKDEKFLEKQLSIEILPSTQKELNFYINATDLGLTIESNISIILPYLESVKDLKAEIENGKIKLSWSYDLNATFYIYKGSDDNNIEFLTTTSKKEYIDEFPSIEKPVYYINAVYNEKESGLSKIDAKELIDSLNNSNIMYLLFVRSFFDSNGDGNGDLNGITQKLDYLEELGISTLWLMPIFKSNSYHGYDVIDYYSINSEYGTMYNFEELISKAHSKNLKIVLDIPLNHSSDQHPWFLDAIENTTNSKYWNYYIMSLDDHSGQNHWHYKINSKGEKIWYFGIFSHSMPDFNLDNPEVREFHKDVLSYWISEGVDGFRFDAVKHFYGYDWEDGLDQSSEYSKELARYVKSIKDDAIIVGEAYDGSTETLKKFAPMPVFDFSFMFNIRENYEGKDNLLSNQWYKEVDYEGISPYYFPFINNHDLDRFISVLIDEKYKDEYYGTAQFAICYTILSFLEGMPTIYYGDEIGLRGFKWNGPVYDEPVREPMQWYKLQDGVGQTYWTKEIYQENNVTFGNANIDGAVYDDPNDGISVEEEEVIDNSLLNYFKTIFNIRKEYYALSHGELFVEKDWKNLIVLKKRFYDQTALVVINPDPIYPNKYTVPSGYTQVFYADLNDKGNGFIFYKTNNVLDNDAEYTINPRQVYIFVK